MRLAQGLFLKICGITALQDAEIAVEAGANALGFVFVPRSPRFIAPEAAARIAWQLPPHIVRVGLFVDAPLDTVRRIADRCQLTLIQLHGTESPAYCDQVGRPVMKAFRVKDATSLEPLPRYRVAACLLDAYVPGQSGGTGQTFNWNLVRGVSRRYRIVLAGGLTPDNVADAIRQVRPYGVDVSSGVEQAPGRKDPEKVKQFIRRAREAWDALD